MKTIKIYCFFVFLLSFTVAFGQSTTSSSKSTTIESYTKYKIHLNSEISFKLIFHNVFKDDKGLGEYTVKVLFPQMRLYTVKDRGKIFNNNSLINNEDNLDFNFEKLLPRGSPVFSISYAEVYGLYSGNFLPLKWSCIY